MSFLALFFRINHQLGVGYINVQQTLQSDLCKCEDNDIDNYILKLEIPWHHFDSNHWFHSNVFVKFNAFL